MEEEEEDNNNGDKEQDISEKEVLRIWLRDKCKLEQYYDIFIENGWDDMDSLNYMKEEDLRQMNINKMGHIRKLLGKIKEYSQ